jgi:hypothetical protein
MLKFLMNTAPFSKHIFWSWKPDSDLPENLVIQQVIAYGEISDFRLLSKLFPRQKIIEAIGKWKERDKYKKHIFFLEQVFLHE